MTHNNLKPNVLLFYEKGNYEKVYGLDEIKEEVEYICAVCYNHDKREIRARPINRLSLRYGRHFPKQDIYCTEIYKNIKNKEYIRNFDVSKVICAIRKAIDETTFRYYYEGECCLLNTSVYKEQYSSKFIGDIKIEAGKEFFHITDDVKSVYFLFENYEIEGQHLILNTSKTQFMEGLLTGEFNVFCKLSDKNEIHLCEKCYNINSEFLKTNDVPEKYDDPNVVCPVKSEFLKQKIKQPEKIAELLTKYNHPITYTDDYDLVYGLPFCYKVTNKIHYDFYVCVFLFILKQKGLNGDKYKNIYKEMSIGLEKYFKNRKYDEISAWYELTLKPILEPPPPPPPPRPSFIRNGIVKVNCNRPDCTNTHPIGYEMCYTCRKALSYKCSTPDCTGTFTNENYTMCYKCFIHSSNH